MEIPCYVFIVPFILKYGRRIPLISFFGICGVSVLSSLALSGGKKLEFLFWGHFFLFSLSMCFLLLSFTRNEIIFYLKVSSESLVAKKRKKNKGKKID